MIMWNELGISGGTAIVILIALYFVIKWAVKNGIKEAYSAITGKKTEEELNVVKAIVKKRQPKAEIIEANYSKVDGTEEDVRNEKELKELGFELEDK